MDGGRSGGDDPLSDSVSGIKHPAFREAQALTRPAARAETGRYLVEGLDLVRQALAPNARAPVFAVFATPDAAKAIPNDCPAPVYILGGGLIGKLVGTGYETAVTALAIVAQSVVSVDELLAADADAARTLLLVGERIQDPRNVGVLIRTAEAAGCGALLLSADSSEPWARAAVRSTTGSILRLPLCVAPDLPATLRALAERGVRVVASSARAEHLVYDADLSPRPLALVVGNETEGMTGASRAAATDFVRLPMAANGASSLNVTVAAGVLVYEAIRQSSAR